ncbi:MAG TPA: Gfo/Idh/MocA family oxidoreductase [Fimbriimonadales bacterium]|nr:Gfo/Idh/MocA family oxidoreductase [Fimbriimonadales bacterium]
MQANDGLTRRDFLKKSAMVTASMVIPSGVFALGSETIKVGLIGCGGRGTGAAADAAEADPAVVLWAMGDLFQDRLESSRKHLQETLKDRCQVPNERAFVGFDAYKQVLESGVDIVILTAPPGFRPQHLRVSVEAGKHVFMEKPIAVDAPGVRSVIDSSDLARAKGLCIVAGTQRRHDVAYREAMKRIHDGALGEVVACYAYWNQGGLWMVPRKEGWSDVEWQIRNWLYFTWLSGDHIVEQHIHNIDVCNWAMNDHPVKAISLGGRQVRTDPNYGHIYDHFATEFEYANGVKMVSMCRQIDGTAWRVGEHIVGTKGTSDANNWINGESAWRFEGERPNPYVLEHKRLIQAIRTYPINEGRQVAESTMTAIMGRMAAYTGQEVTWEQAYNSQESLFPDKVEFGPKPVASVAMPGSTKLI